MAAACLGLTQQLRGYEAWSENEILDRGRKLFDIAVAHVWPHPVLQELPATTLESLMVELVAAVERPTSDVQEDAVSPINVTGEKEASMSSYAPTEKEHIDALPSELQQVYLELRKRAMAFGSDINVHVTPMYFAFRASKIMFAEIAKRKACLDVLIRPEGFSIAKNASAEIYGIRVTHVRHGWSCNHNFKVDGSSLMFYVMDNVEKLLRQSYDAVAS